MGKDIPTEDPNQDMLDLIYRIEDRAYKMLSVLIIITGIVIYAQSNLFFKQPQFTACVTILLLLSSLLFYFLPITKSPNFFIHEHSRKMLMRFFQENLLKQEDIVKIIVEDKDNRQKLIRLFNLKSKFITIAHSSFLGFILILTTTFFIVKYHIGYFSNTLFIIAYGMAFIVVASLFYFRYFENSIKNISLKKTPSETTPSL